MTREHMGMREALSCPRVAVSHKQSSFHPLLPRFPSCWCSQDFPPRPLLYLRSLFLDAALFQVVRKAMGAGWLGEGCWWPLLVTAAAGGRDSQGLSGGCTWTGMQGGPSSSQPWRAPPLQPSCPCRRPGTRSDRTDRDPPLDTGLS